MNGGLASDTLRDNTQKKDSRMIITPGPKKQATIHIRLKKSILKKKEDWIVLRHVSLSNSVKYFRYFVIPQEISSDNLEINCHSNQKYSLMPVNNGIIYYLTINI